MPNIYDTGYVKSLFNKMSGSYERMNYLTSFGFSLRWRNQFVRQTGHSLEAVSVIDLMTGMGETWHAIKKNYPNAKVTAIDFSPGMLEHAMQRNKRHYSNSVEILELNMLDNDLPSGYFDCVFCAFGLKTFDETQIEILAGETKRILKPGGKFAFVEVSEPPGRMLNYIYSLYLRLFIPVLGRLLLGDPQEYRMLHTYTSNFKNAKLAFDIFTNVGLKVSYDEYFGGCASGIHGHRSY